MRSLLSHISFKGSLFWRYFSLLSVVVCIFLFALTTFINYSSKVLQSSYFEQTQENFYQNSETFSNDLNLIHSLISTVRSSDNFILISLAEQPVTLQQRFHFNKVQSSFKQQCSLLSQIEDGFIYFEHSSACVTTQNYYPDSEDCFRAFYSHEDPLFLEDLVKNIDSRHKLCTIPTRMLSINGTAPASYLLTLMKPQSSSQIFGFFYPEETILNSFQIDALPEDTCFKLISNTGEVLLSYNEDKTTQSDYIEFTAPIPSLSGTAVLGIPQSYFDALTNESQAFAQKTLLSSVFIGMLLCILFSYIGVKPFQFLIHEHALSQPESGNEVTAIDSFLKNTKQNNEVLRNMLLSSALTRAFYALPMNENEYARLASDFPIFQKPLLLAIIRRQELKKDGWEADISFDAILNQLPENTICEHMNLREICVIMSTELTSYEMLQRILVDMNGQFEGNPRFVAGVSAPFTGIDHISNAVHQAQLCLPEDGARIISHFTDDNTDSAQLSSNSSFDLMHMQQVLSCWNKNEILLIIHSAAKNSAPSGHEHPEETFYNILTLLRNAAYAGNISFADYETTTYQHHLSPAINMAILEEIVEYLFNQKTRLQVQEIQQLSQDLIQYIHQNYSNPALTLPLLAQEFGVAERFVHKALITTTGSNFNKFLMTVRMQEAARLLRETDKSNMVISELCGIPAVCTFYRNFKGYYHMTPAEYKESLTGGNAD